MSMELALHAATLTAIVTRGLQVLNEKIAVMGILFLLALEGQILHAAVCKN